MAAIVLFTDKDFQGGSGTFTTKQSMKSKLALIFASATLALTSAAVPAIAISSGFIKITGETPPAGYRLVGYNEALKNQDKLCSILNEWDIARLDNNASMDGPGYGCKIRPDDNRTLGHAIVVKK